MTAPLRISIPFDIETAKSLSAGQEVLLTGRMLTARDAAHKRLCELIRDGKTLPVDINGAIIYFVGPSPAREGRAIGAAGPTTSSRMDSYSPLLLHAGLRGMIGKGYRSEEVRRELIASSAVHFTAFGGTAALFAEKIKSAKILAYGDLGTEAIRELIVEDFPVILAYDCHGNSVYPNENKIE